MIKIKKFYAEYYVDFKALNFLLVEEFKIKIFEYLIDNPVGKFEANFNVSFENKNHKYYSNVKAKPNDNYESFVGFGDTEEEAIKNLVDFIEEKENIELLKSSNIKIDF